MKKYLLMASQIQEAKKRLEEAFFHKDQNHKASQDWQKSCVEFDNLYRSLHTNKTLYPDLLELKQGNPQQIQIALDYLSANLYYYRSGYKKEGLATLLKNLLQTHFHLFSIEKLKQLELILLNQVKACQGREFRYYCRLAQAIASQELNAQLLELVNSTNAQISQRAKWMLNYTL